ncbi:probable disease resistance protein At4g27220 [Vitis riparia]|uniref:probable disease resistance protein At4g27220 n=1 Tax=Vitis riparia TaxID=96939 RepID=UPI00155AAE58|nr:probable disease resistance protein At4g27220 [Vitis riparia]
MADILISVAAKVAEYLVVPIVRQLSYLFNYRSNLDKLEEQVTRLDDARARLQHDVDKAKRQGDDIEQDVQNWLTRADEMIQRARELIDDENAENTSRLCFNLKLRYQRSRQAKKQSGDIFGKIQESKFDRVSYRPPPRGIWSAQLRDCKALESRASILNEIMEALRNDDIRMIGVWGMGGVGKTTLAYQVAEKAEKDKLFEMVVMALKVSQFPNVTKIQEQIASVLRLEFKEEGEPGRAARLSKSLQNNKTVLVILDDIWEELSLANIGIPYGDAHRGCKVLLTSRNEGVLSRKMGTQKNFHVQHLCEEEAWSLFKKTAGDSVEELKSIAIEVVRECAGLPVAIVTVAKALKGQSEPMWNNALQELKRSAPTNIEGVSKNVYSCLELSYNHLEGDEVKRLFLLCGMLGYGDISMDQLLKSGMGLDLFEHVSSLEQIRNKLVTLVKILKDSSLLLDAEDRYRSGVGPGVFFGNNDENKFVRMHDVVGDVARAIAAKDPHRFVVIKEALELEEWQGKEEFRNCSRISLQCRDLRELPERLVCSKLELFLLNGNDPSLRIPNTFFQVTELLKVLDLSAMHLAPLPSSLGFLSNLRTLRVYRCKLQDIALIGELKKLQVLSFASCEIQRLPKEFMQLTDLRALDLWECFHLIVIPRNVISSLSRLEHLCLGESFTKWGAEGFGSGESNNACLSELNNLSHLKTLCIEIIDLNLLSTDLVFEKLTRYVISVSSMREYVNYNRSARTLKLCRVNKPCLVDCFSKLFKTVEDLDLSHLEDTKHVLYELHTDDFLQLKRLDIRYCPGIQYIVDSTKGVPSHSAFPILEKLFLSGLQNMDAVCYGPIPEGSFGKLRSLRVDGCERLKSFISLPMEQGRDGSVLPEMGSLDSTRDFKTVEDLELRRFGDTKHVLFELGTVDFLQLKGLVIGYCPGIQYIVNSMKGVPSRSAFPILEELELYRLENMDAVCYGPIPEGSFGKLRSLTVYDCKRLKSFNSLPMEQGRDGSVLPEMGSLDSTRDFSTGASATQELSRSDVPTPFFNEQVTLPSLEDLTMENLDNVIAIWHSQLPLESWCKLKSLGLSCCSKLLNVFPSNILKGFQSLEDVSIYGCDSIEEIFDLGGVNSKEIHDIATIPLRILDLDRLNSLKSIWNKDPQGLVSFQNLQSLKVVGCPCLKYIFPIMVAKGLVQLKFLGIKYCGVEEIVANENGDEVMSSLFPELTFLTLEGLDKLRGFYRGTHIARGPHLKKLIMLKWDQVGTLFQEIDSEGYIDSPIQQSIFLLEKDAFLNLELLILKGSKMKIWQGQFSGESFCKLRVLKIKMCHNILVVIPCSRLPKLHNLKELYVSKCNSVKEVFQMKELVNQEYQVETLPRLTKMFLEDLPLLTYLSGLVQIFENLHSLTVSGCGNLIYLVTSSIAKTLVQLKELIIEQCRSVKEIVGHEGGEEPYDIVFSKLQRLKLVNLQSLKWFCSTRCIFKFPSLEQFEVIKCPQMEFFCERVSSTPRVKEVQIDDHVEEHLGCDFNTIICNITFEKFLYVKVMFEKDPEALEATIQLHWEDYEKWDFGDSDDDYEYEVNDDDDDDEVNDDDDDEVNDDDDEVKEETEEDVMRKMRMRHREMERVIKGKEREM